MIILESNYFVKYVIDNRLIKSHCTVRINKNTLNVDYIFVSDVLTYQLHEKKPLKLYFDQDDELTFSFEVPNVIQLINIKSSVRFITKSESKIIEFSCNTPHFMAIINGDTNHMDKIPESQVPYVSIAEYINAYRAIRAMKSFATELGCSIEVDFGKEFWAVGIAQAIMFGQATGFIGSIQSTLFERIFDVDAEVSQISDTALIVRKLGDEIDCYIHVPINKSTGMTDNLNKLVGSCKRQVCKTAITKDVEELAVNITKNIKKESITIQFSTDRMDLIYSNIIVNLTTVSRDANISNAIQIQTPVKALVPVMMILAEPAQVSTSGDLICMMTDNKGLLLSGIIA